ncbi:LapA family protein [candidate division WOR-3 bacterium]|nr:LapA family protein [candidate division WOR-3 bacterium]
MKIVMFIIVGVVFILGISFAAFNSGSPPPMATVRFFGQHDVSVVLFGFICFASGIVSIILFTIADELRLRAKIRKLRREQEKMRKEINALRNLPLASEILTKDIEEKRE